MSKGKKRIYISLPISGYDISERCATAKRAAALLEEEGWEVFNPLENGLPHDAGTHSHMRRDLNVLTDEVNPFSAILFLERWTHSKGCEVEFQVATAIGLEIYFEECDGHSLSVKFK